MAAEQDQQQLGSLLIDLGRYAEAKEAYERLADATGVPKPAPAHGFVRSA